METKRIKLKKVIAYVKSDNGLVEVVGYAPLKSKCFEVSQIIVDGFIKDVLS